MSRELWKSTTQRAAMGIALAMLLAACGGGDDASPTATSEPADSQPTEAVTVESEAATPVEATGVNATPDESGPISTPSSVQDESGSAAATPQSSDGGTVDTDDADASPEASPATSTRVATPIAEGTADDTNEAGDGTTGPDVPTGLIPSTPIPTAPADASPAASPNASPMAGSSSVDSCTVEVAPEFTGDNDQFRVTDGVNFRSGPGTDCDFASSEPIVAFQTVTVTSDPVTRENDGGTWVQVEYDGATGWLNVDFLEPVNDD